uniref:NADH dehydrogenase subunit 4 n=1 Tax=Elthusa poutassouiensis TaxID=3104314 RepID=UPI002E77CF83|nr:NADH dehydrogenase subunit 4 [Elthusa poutassouiensis]WPS93555.1 NADH dehydrogenase subunit 4 [Elthusa poutassouiensis]
MSLLFMSSAMFLSESSSILGLSLVLMFLLSSWKHDIEWFMNYGVLMLDNLSLLLVSLSIWIVLFMVLSMLFDSKKYDRALIWTILILMIFLFAAFSIVNYMGFYIFFESCLIPTLVLIIGWGYQPERVGAGMYMMLYTISGSLPLLCSLFYLSKLDMSWMVLTESLVFDSWMGGVLFMLCFIGFLIKLPMFAFHLWLPKAHVEAPVGGSMILAGLLLKLGGYGMIRLVGVLSGGGSFMKMLVVSWSLFGGLVASMLCLRQFDMKCLIALSSVVHMAIIVGGVMIQSFWGYSSVVLIMVGHGLCSSGLFCAANMLYKWTGSRSLSVVKGVQVFVPSMSLMWFLLCSSNMSAPPSLSLLGEISGIIGMVSWSWSFVWILFFMVFMSGAYSLYLFMSVMHGKCSEFITGCKASVGDYVLIFMHWLPLNVMFIMNLY